jgi:hypothetical protein
LNGEISQNIKSEKIDAALDNIIKLMNLNEKEKLKRVEFLSALEKKVVRQLQMGKNDAAIEELKNIIDEYRSLKLNQRADILEITFNQFLMEYYPKTVQKTEELQQSESTEAQKDLQILEDRSKQAIHKVLQGKAKTAENDIIDIIREFQQLGLGDRAQLLENWLQDFRGKKSDVGDLNKPLNQLLQNDPALQEQLLSYRIQKVLKQFQKGDPKKAVVEFTTIVNDYKRQGRLDTVETLEIWFNLFITKTYLLKPKVAQPSPQPIPQSIQRPAQPSALRVSPTPGPHSPSTSIAGRPPSQTENKPPLSDDVFKSKISKIKSMLKEFEESHSL